MPDIGVGFCIYDSPEDVLGSTPKSQRKDGFDFRDDNAIE